VAAVDGEVLVVVGRDQTALYEYFRWAFARMPAVSVVLDRRFGERRGHRASQAAGGERRSGDRRRAIAPRAELLARGFMLVRRASVAGRREGEGRR